MGDETAQPRRRGRPKGLPKSGGRKPGTPNRNIAQTRSRIAKEADPLGMLIRVANGKRFEAAAEPKDTKRTWVYPTLEQRIHAAQALARKVLPDLKAIEIETPDMPIATQIERVIISPARPAEKDKTIIVTDIERGVEYTTKESQQATLTDEEIARARAAALKRKEQP